MELKILNFIIESGENWKEILQNAPYFISIKEDDEYYLFKYRQAESDMQYEIVRECRGLILDRETMEPVSLSFTKFFNYGEQYASSIDWKTAVTQEKVDGSKMCVWRHKGRWHISSSGTIDAYKANVSDLGFTYGDLFEEAVQNLGLSIDDFFDKLDTRFCYTFELVSPKAPIIINYKKTMIYYIGLRDMVTFDEVDPSFDETISNLVARPKVYKLNTLENCLKAVEKLGLKQEGYVIVDAKFRRIKIKSHQYLIAHYLNNNGVQSNARLLEIVEKNEIDEFCTYFPNWREKLETIKQDKLQFLNRIYEATQKVQQFVKDNNIDEVRNSKVIAEFVNTNYKDIASFLFKILRTDLVEYFIENEWQKLIIDKRVDFLMKKD